jgi:hypothetical protein
MHCRFSRLKKFVVAGPEIASEPVVSLPWLILSISSEAFSMIWLRLVF